MYKKKFICIMMSLLIPTICFAFLPIPARVGGTVTIDGHPLKHNEAKNYSFQVTRENGSSLSSSAPKAGLNGSNWYIIDIPIFNASDQPGGANPGDTLKIHVYEGGKELSIISPVKGMIKCGESGSTTQININAQHKPVKNIPPKSK